MWDWAELTQEHVLLDSPRLFLLLSLILLFSMEEAKGVNIRYLLINENVGSRNRARSRCGYSGIETTPEWSIT